MSRAVVTLPDADRSADAYVKPRLIMSGQYTVAQWNSKRTQKIAQGLWVSFSTDSSTMGVLLLKAEAHLWKQNAPAAVVGAKRPRDPVVLDKS